MTAGANSPAPASPGREGAATAATPIGWVARLRALATKRGVATQSPTTKAPANRGPALHTGRDAAPSEALAEPNLPALRALWRLLRHWLPRLTLIALLLVATTSVWLTNRWLTERFTADTRTRTEIRQTLYIGNILSELQRASVVPLLLARDPTLTMALQSGDFSRASQRLIALVEELGTVSLQLVDTSGRIVAATDRNLLGENLAQAPYVVAAQRSNNTVFATSQAESGAYLFTYARRIQAEGQMLGAVLVHVDLKQFEPAWRRFSDAVMVLDSEGHIVLSTEPRWRGLSETEALEKTSVPSALQRALRATADFTSLPVDAWFNGKAVMRQEARIPFQGWRMVTFSPYQSVRERVNGVLALEIMGFAILLALAFYLSSRRANTRSAAFRAESEELRRLNARLQREITSRQRAEKHLQVAEQTLAQSSKLAALGEMSAGVSHELNQPLAAMKTYLAGARLLLQRKRTEEALSSFQRLDGLIERMGAITRQLKSYARKGGDAFSPLDLRDCVSGALAIMEPQLKSRRVRIERNLPRERVEVQGDPIRIEQVVINLLRNALDATRTAEQPAIVLTLAAGAQAVLSVRDNGRGISDLENLFEPFYTTKAPGDGTGLGLAISSGIVADHGGRLLARNCEDGGAVFEMELPLWIGDAAADPAADAPAGDGAGGASPTKAAEGVAVSAETALARPPVSGNGAAGALPGTTPPTIAPASFEGPRAAEQDDTAPAAAVAALAGGGSGTQTQQSAHAGAEENSWPRA